MAVVVWLGGGGVMVWLGGGNGSGCVVGKCLCKCW